ncbi:MAG: preprotein translocase subunit SecG [Candidatus Poribacteria bacterium]|nr:preprotein translocase subunit SecG [Candidatus Poribacteria bacterium]
MNILVGFVVAAFVAICFLLVIVILLQDSKGEGLSSSAFGGSGLESVLGGHGATTFLSRVTTWTAISFMVIALFLMKFYGESNDIVPIEQSNVSQSVPEDAVEKTVVPDSSATKSESPESNTSEETDSAKTETEGSKSGSVSKTAEVPSSE